MAVPTNLTALTATELVSLPADVTQDVHDAGVNYTVWYKFTAPVGCKVIGAWGFTTIADSYASTIKPYDGPASAPVSINGIAAINKPIQFPVTAGNEYFLEFTKNNNTSPASIRIKVEAAPDLVYLPGSIIVNDDASGFPLAILSPTVDYTALKFISPFPGGEAGDILTTGIMAFEDLTDNSIKVYGSAFNLIFSTAVQVGTIRIRACNGATKFYVGLDANPAQFKTLSSAGVLSAGTTLTGNVDLESLCASNDELILYFANRGFGVAIKKWDIALNVAMADLVASVATYQIPDILVLADGNIVALYYNSTTKDVFARRYSPAGATLSTYALGVQTGSTKPRLAYAIDDANSFWAWTHTNTGISIFRNVKCSDGTIITTRNHVEYEGGAMVPTETATPLSRFGNSFSCPFMIARLGSYTGLYSISRGKTHDTLFAGGSTVDVKIPNPLAQFAFLGGG